MKPVGGKPLRKKLAWFVLLWAVAGHGVKSPMVMRF